MPAFTWPTDVHPAARDPFVWAIINEAQLAGKTTREEILLHVVRGLWEDRDKLLEAMYWEGRPR